VTDSSGLFIFTNHAASTLTGYSAAELLDLSVWDLTPYSKHHEAERLWRVFLDEHEQSGECPLLTKNGRIMTTPYAARAHVLPDIHVSILRSGEGPRAGLRRQRMAERAAGLAAEEEPRPTPVHAASITQRIRAEFLEMPGLWLTPHQLQWLCGVGPAMCQAVLDTLVGDGFLALNHHGAYGQVTDVANRMRARPAKATVARSWQRIRRQH